MIEREETIRAASDKIMKLAEMHIIYGLDKTEGFRGQKDELAAFIREHHVDIKKDMDPLTRNLYQRYFL
jgi:hypothetical protein